MSETYISDNEIKKICSGESVFNKKLINEGSDSKWTSRLPHGPMRMIDRAWYDFDKGTGKYGKGYLRAEKDISMDEWFFYSHFLGDPVMPGTIGLDGCYQCLGLSLLIMGFQGVARALAGTFEYNGQVLTTVKKTIYRLDVKRIFKNPSPLLIADVDYFKDNDHEPIYKLRNARMGYFREGELERSLHYQPDWNKIKENMIDEMEESKAFYLKNFGREGY